jgi:hypothetical protein
VGDDDLPFAGPVRDFQHRKGHSLPGESLS